MKNKGTPLKRIEGLLMEYAELRKKSKYDDLSGGCTDAERKSFATRAVTAVLDAAPQNSPYVQQAYNNANGRRAPIQDLVGILHALESDLESGYAAEQRRSKGKLVKILISPFALFHWFNFSKEIKVAIVTGFFLLAVAFVPIIFGSKKATGSKTAVSIAMVVIKIMALPQAL